MIRKILTLGLVSLIFAGITSCQKKEAPETEGIGQKISPKIEIVTGEEKKEVTFAMLPQMSNAELFKCWDPLLKYLEKTTEIKFKQVFPKDFTEHVQWGGEGKIDFAYSNPFTYIQMAPKPGRPRGQLAIAIAVESDQRGANFYGEFIVRADNPDIKEFKDIKGRKGWIVGYKSAGYLFQKGYALERDIDLPNDCILTESPGNKQEKVIMAVYNRETEFGLVRNGMREKLKDRIDLSQIKVLAESKRYPSWAFSAYDGLGPKTVEKVKQALLNIPPEVFKEAELPGGVTGFQQATDKDFDDVRELAQKVKLAY